MLTLLPTVALAAGTTLVTPTGLTWDGATAKWNPVTGADNKNIRVLQDGEYVGDSYVDTTSVDLLKYMQGNGDGDYRYTAFSRNEIFNLIAND